VQGTIIQLSTSLGGLPKREVSGGRFISFDGLEGDRQAHPEFHGGLIQAVLIVAAEVVDELVGKGYPVFYGALGENLTTRGMSIRDLRIGDQLRAGGATLEITKPRSPCLQLDVYGPAIKQEIYDTLVKKRDPSSPHWGMSGFYTRVITPGPVGAGDIIEVVATLA